MTSEIREGLSGEGSVHERGVWCPHKVKILQPDPESRLEYPPMVPIEPWPCDSCTWEDWKREEQEMVDEYYQERWREYWDSQMPIESWGY